MPAAVCYSPYCCYSKSPVLPGKTSSISPQAITALVTLLLFAASLISWWAGAGKITSIALGSGASLCLALSLLLNHRVQIPPPEVKEKRASPPSPKPIPLPASPPDEPLDTSVSEIQTAFDTSTDIATFGEKFYQRDWIKLTQDNDKLFAFVAHSIQNSQDKPAFCMDILEALKTTSAHIFKCPNSDGETLADIAIRSVAEPSIVRLLVQAHGNYKARQAIEALNKSPAKHNEKYKLGVLLTFQASTQAEKGQAPN
jgi:hypothetical protein